MTSLPARDARARTMRVVVLAIALVVAVTGTALIVEPVQGANLSKVIAATRRNQVSTEAAMRAADGQWKSLKRDLKATRKKMRRSSRKLARVRALESRLVLAVDGARGRLDAALTNELPLETPPEAAVAADPVLTLTARTASELLRDDADDVVATGPLVVAPPVRRLRATPAEIEALREQLAREQRSLRQAQAKERRIVKARRGRIRHIATIRRQRRATVARRESAERALGSWIKSMTQLAKRRAAKKSKVRPGRRDARFARPSNGALSQGYHRGHDGLDIVRYKGAPIRASAVGVVAFVGWNPWDQGRRAFVVVIGHSTGYETIYGHLLPKRKVQVGQLVRKGQLIGLMGNTGHSTGPHVHWEVSRGWRTIDPNGVS